MISLNSKIETCKSQQLSLSPLLKFNSYSFFSFRLLFFLDLFHFRYFRFDIIIFSLVFFSLLRFLLVRGFLFLWRLTWRETVSDLSQSLSCVFEDILFDDSFFNDLGEDNLEWKFQSSLEDVFFQLSNLGFSRLHFFLINRLFLDYWRWDSARASMHR